MADVFRIITFSGNRPNVVLDLNDQVGYVRDREAGLQYTPGQPTVQYSRRAKRHGGAQPVGVTHDNGTLAWTAYVKGATYQEITARVEALAAQVDDVALGRFVQWQPEGGLSSYLEVKGPGSWQPTYDPVQFAQTFSVRYAVTLSVAPLVRWDPMTILDGLGATSTGLFNTADYSFDALAATDVTLNAGGYLTAPGTLTSERRVRNTSRGYTHLEGEAVVIGQPNTTITSYKQGVVLRALNATNYVEVYVDDNGTNSRLRIDVVVAGVRTNRATTNLAARMTSAANVGVRARVEGNVVSAEHFIAAKVSGDNELIDPATTTASYTLAAGAEQGMAAGNTGFSWVPQNTSARLMAFRFSPFTRRAATLPATFTFFSATSGPAVPPLPGKAPALVDALIGPSGGTAAPVWAQVAWAHYADTSTNPPFGLIEAESGSNLTGWASSVQAGGHGGNDLRATTAGAFTGVATWPLDLSSVALDDFADLQTGAIDLEVWARAVLTSTLVNPRLTTMFTQGTVVAGARYTAEWGSAAKSLTVPTTGTVYRDTRLGTLTLNRQAAAGGTILIQGNTDAGSTGAFGLDYLWVVPSRRRALGPTGVPQDGSYPAFVMDTTAWTKRIRWDLSGELRQTSTGSGARIADHGLSGSLLEIQPGTPKVWVKLASLVPDDPSATNASEQLAHTATVHLDVTPRSYLLRDA